MKKTFHSILSSISFLLLFCGCVTSIATLVRLNDITDDSRWRRKEEVRLMRLSETTWRDYSSLDAEKASTALFRLEAETRNLALTGDDPGIRWLYLITLERLARVCHSLGDMEGVLFVTNMRQLLFEQSKTRKIESNIVDELLEEDKLKDIVDFLDDRNGVDPNAWNP